MLQKMDVHYHLPGDVKVTDANTKAKLTGSVLDIIKTVEKAPNIIVPPLQLSRFTSCCDNTQHCSNINTVGSQVGMLEDLTKVRNSLKASLLKAWVIGWSDF